MAQGRLLLWLQGPQPVPLLWVWHEVSVAGRGGTPCSSVIVSSGCKVTYTMQLDWQNRRQGGSHLSVAAHTRSNM